MLRFRRMKTLQKFASVHANVHNHFNLDRHPIDRTTYKDAAPQPSPSGGWSWDRTITSKTEPDRVETGSR